MMADSLIAKVLEMRDAEFAKEAYGKWVVLVGEGAWERMLNDHLERGPRLIVRICQIGGIYDVKLDSTLHPEDIKLDQPRHLRRCKYSASYWRTYADMEKYPGIQVGPQLFCSIECFDKWKQEVRCEYEGAIFTEHEDIDIFDTGCDFCS